MKITAAAPHAIKSQMLWTFLSIETEITLIALQ
jgi:hypothetical protein